MLRVTDSLERHMAMGNHSTLIDSMKIESTLDEFVTHFAN